MSEAPLLDVAGLTVSFPMAGGRVDAVRGIDLRIGRGETLGLVGESGCGKSVSMLAVMGLLPPAVMVGGSAKLAGSEILGLPQRALAELRGRAIGMVFQDPLTALNPVLTIGEQIGEAIGLHNPGMGRSELRSRAIELLELVSIPEPTRRLAQYPHEFSGGMRQRVMIAMAVANNPQLLIADEPTTALDVTVQAQVLEVLKRMRDTLGIGLIIITHDLGVVAGTADRVAVMYAGEVVEQGPVEALFASPRHPYTQGLLASIPSLAQRGQRLHSIEGAPPSLAARPYGCAFHPRCAHAAAMCRIERPLLRRLGPVETACHFAESLSRPGPAARRAAGA